MFKNSEEGTGAFNRGDPDPDFGDLLEAAMAAQYVAPGLTDQHAVHRQHMQPHLQQNVLQPTVKELSHTVF